MKNKLLITCALGILGYLNPRMIYAQQITSSDTTDLYNLSLEDLMKIEVVTASKSSEQLNDAPAVISVVSEQEIKGYGAMHLSEILDRVTGVYFMGTYALMNNMASIRGDVTSHWNNHVLILLDGRPVRDSYAGGNYATLYMAFPIEQIDHIEIVRGPGSVLYGSGAYMGVINVITKTLDKQKNSAYVRTGSFGTNQAGLTFGTKIKNVEVTTGLVTGNSSGWENTVRDASAMIRNKANTADSLILPARTLNMQKNYLGTDLHVKYKGLKVNTFVAHQHTAGMINNGSWLVPTGAAAGAKPLPVWYNHLTVAADAGYQTNITEKWQTSINATYNHNTFSIRRENNADDDIYTINDDVLLEWTNYLNLHKKLNLVFGGVANNMTGYQNQPPKNADGTVYTGLTIQENSNPFKSIPKYNTTWYSGYIQAAYTPFSFMKLVAGAQANKVPDVALDIAPRLGLVVNSSYGLGAKLLYGEAFRAPMPGLEKAIYVPGVVIGTATLKPERVSTAEAQVSYRYKSYELAATYFSSEQTNLIGRTLASDPNNIVANTPQMINTGTLKSSGFELEAKALITKELSVNGSFASQSSKTDKGYKDYFGTPLSMVKLGVNYNASEKGWSIGIWNSYFDKGGNIRAKYSSENTPANFEGTAADANPKVKAFNYLTANAVFNLNKLAGFKSAQEISVELYGTNLLNSKIYYAEYNRRELNSIQGRAGRAINGTLRVTF